MVYSEEVGPSKGKGKFISDTSDIIKVKPEVFNLEQSDSEVIQEQVNALIFSIQTSNMENQTRALETQYENELLRAEQTEQEFVQAKKEAEEVEQHVAIVDSKEVKSSKGKGKFVSDVSDTMKENPEVFNPEPDMLYSKVKKTPEQMKTLISNVFKTLSNSEIDKDPKVKHIVDLVKVTSELYEKVNEQKAWALRKVAESKMSVKKHYSELQELRSAKAKGWDTENKRDNSEKSDAIKIKEECIQRACFQLSAVNNTVGRLELENAQIRADAQAHKLSASESEKKLREIMKKEKKCVKKLGDMDNQISSLKTQYEKELQRAMQMEQESIQTEMEAKEVEIQWKQEVKERDRMLALVAEETRLARTQNARSKAYLSNLRQQVDTECQVAEDECRRLKDELSLLRLPRPIDDFLPDNIDFTCNFDEADSSSSKQKSHLLCMVCMENVVSVLFLPCTHQVLCFPCYESLQSNLGHCSYCGVGIEQSIKVKGRSSRE